jgi:hypothetical protein
MLNVPQDGDAWYQAGDIVADVFGGSGPRPARTNRGAWPIAAGLVVLGHRVKN